jgi:hypothetical protein
MRVFFALMLVSAALAAFEFGTTCNKCDNGEECCGGETCCGKGGECCPSNSTCCGETCCAIPSESCCQDKVHGDICCEVQNTFCCPPSTLFPSRCCPRWTVCCDTTIGGRYGCCDITDTQQTVDSERTERLQDPPRAFGTAQSTGAKGSMLFLKGSLTTSTTELAGLTVDLASGDYTQVHVSGYDDWQEITRIFTYDPNRNVFYLPQTNYLEQPPYPIVLYTLDATSGSGTSLAVTGAEGAVASYKYEPSLDVLYMSTNSAGGYTYYTVNVQTGAAQAYSSVANTTDYQYGGWFNDISADGKTAYRVGVEDPVTQNNPGVGVIDLSTAEGSVNWISSYDIPIPSGFTWYFSLSCYGDSFLSLAQDSDNELSLVLWNLNGTANVLSTLGGDAHTTPKFGPLAQYVNQEQTQIAVAFVYNGFTSILDRWVLTLVDLPSGATTELYLSPRIVAEISSVSGVGIP